MKLKLIGPLIEILELKLNLKWPTKTTLTHTHTKDKIIKLSDVQRKWVTFNNVCHYE